MTSIFPKWLFTLNPFQVCILLSNSVFLFQFKDMHLFQGNYCMSKYLFMASSHLSFSNTKLYWGNLSVLPSQLSLSGFWTRTHVVNLSVVWLKDTLRPDATSILSLAKEDKEKKHAYSAFCSAIFPFCSPNSRTPASWRWNGGRLGRKPRTTTAPWSIRWSRWGLVNHYTHFHPRVREELKNGGKDRLDFT